MQSDAAKAAPLIWALGLFSKVAHKPAIRISVILGVVFSLNFAHASECNEVIVNVSILSPEETRVVDFTKDRKIIVYRRTERQIQNAMNSVPNGYEGKFPSWWKNNKHLLDGKIAISKTRSKLKDFFVFWPYSPNYGYFLTYVGEENVGKIGGKHWYGGFLDPVTGAAYDTTGRPLTFNVIDKAGKTITKLSKASLMIPKHNFSKDGKTLTLLCE